MKKAKEAAVQYQASTKVPLNADWMERLRQAAEWKGVSVEEAVQQAVQSYVGQYGIEKIKRERAAYERLRPELLKKYRGQYVAIHNGEVVEAAPDLRALHSKVFARLSYTPVLHKLVTDEPDRVIVMRSPRVDKR